MIDEDRWNELKRFRRKLRRGGEVNIPTVDFVDMFDELEALRDLHAWGLDNDSQSAA